MSKFVIIVGDTGTGKSRSTKTLNPDETIIIKTIKKELPYRGSEKSYSEEKKNVIVTADYQDICAILRTISEKRSDIKNIVIDDAGYIMSKEFFARSSEIGYSKFTDIAKHMQEILQTCETLRDDINIAIMFHQEYVESEGIIVEVKQKTIGKLLDAQYNPTHLVSTVLYTDITMGKDGNTYEFVTNRTKKGNITIPAKSPEEMFPIRIPNDLQYVFDTMRKYYS